MKMERSNKYRSRKDNKKAKKAPKVPIKTYRWEDIRRARKRGGYPWTHLYKGSLIEKFTPEQFTMDAYRRAKSSSPVGGTDRIDISEVSSWADYSGKTTPTLLQELISEPEDDSNKKKIKRPVSVGIEEYFEDSKTLSDGGDVQVTETQMESGDSSDNISQYLEREERLPVTSKFVKEGERLLKSSKENINNRGKRAKSEETGTRKRKLSGESNYSKYSLPKLKILQKFGDAKRKIKVPKINLPVEKIVKRKSKMDKGHNKLTSEYQKNAIKGVDSTHLQKTDSPVYIHIPLKPPAGETDEFSHLEFECKETNEQAEELLEKKETNSENEEVPNNVKENVDINEFDRDIEIKSKDMKNKDKNDLLDNENLKSPFSSLERGPKVTKKPPLKINPAFKQLLKEVRHLKEKELKEEIDKTDKEFNQNEENTETIMTSINTTVADTKEVNEETPMDLEEQQQTSESESSPKEDIFDKLFETSFSKKLETPIGTDDKPPKTDDDTIRRNVRSKSVEPQNKRRSSMDSTYSRKSLSKLAIIRKLKEASEKIKNTLSVENLWKKLSHKTIDDQKSNNKRGENSKTQRPSDVVITTRLDKSKMVEPVYIHIPLKPLEGQTDDYSYLAGEPLTTTTLETEKEDPTDSVDSTSPVVSPKNDDIHFIFLTPPSDDEILVEKESDIPETPSSSSDDIVLFSSLKKLAQDVVDRVSPESNRKSLLDSVREESVSDKSSINEIDSIDNNKNNAEESIKPNDGNHEIDKSSVFESKEVNEKMIIDVEDGLNEMPKTEEHLKSALKSTEITSPKRVSFKRKSKQKQENDKDDDYELVQAPKEEVAKTVFCSDKEVEINNQLQKDNEKTLGKTDLSEKVETKTSILTTDPSQSMSIDEEITYLDQKILKDTSLEDDYNKWSKITGDHEYEPINPPNEITVITSTSVLPNVTVVDNDNDPKVIFNATDILDKPIEEKKKPFFQFGKMQKDKDKSQNLSGSSDTQSKSSLGKDAPIFNDQIKDSEGPNKFQVALKQGTEQLKTKTNQLRNKLHNIKKPTIHFPKVPEFKKAQFKKSDSKETDVKRFKIEKPKINLHFPKIPDTTTIHIPHISLPGTRKTTEIRTVETRQISTESNADDSEQSTKRHKFDFSFGGTFPRFKKKKAGDEVIFATVPRPIKEKEIKTYTGSSESSSIRIPLHSEDSMDSDVKLDLREQTEQEPKEFEDPISAAITTERYSGNVTVEDEYERENQAINRADYLNRWQHGNFRERKDSESNEDERIIGQLVEQRFGKSELGYDRYGEVDNRIESLQERLRKDEERPRYIEDEDEEFDIRFTQNRHLITDLDNLEDEQNGQIRDGYSSEGSVGLQKKGRLGKIDINSDEFFVVHEIREGFHTPENALAQMNEYDPIGSNRSLPMQIQERQESLQIKAERKPIKKPKRRKTPHVSQEEIPGDEESLESITIPSKPKRRSKRIKKKSEKSDTVVPYQETIPLEMDILQLERLNFPRESLGILGDDEQDDQELEFDKQMLENKESNLNESPRIFQEIKYKLKDEEEPSAPPRKYRSLKSLTHSEDGVLELSDHKNTDHTTLDIGIIESQIIQSDQIASTSPVRPTRRSRSHTSSLSRISLPPSQRDTDSVFTDEGYLGENQQIPSYLIENQNYKRQIFQANEEIPASYLQDDERQPCVEEPCVQDLRDYMGYAIVDKSKQRDPPLPPPRALSRRKKREIESEPKFATVPRNIGLNATPPVRPLRNYSTLSHVQESKKDSSHYENDNENKENEINIGQYIEIDEEINKDLVSGDVVQKMRQRPLPAPPRPPRKPKTIRKSLQDITLQNNIVSVTQGLREHPLKEENVSTQTEPLPADFICEEVRQEPTDTVMTPRTKPLEYLHKSQSENQQIQKFEIYDPRKETGDIGSDVRIRRELITPTQYTFEETVTHGTLLVQPVDGAEILPDHQLSKERLIKISRESFDENEASEIPETFKHLKDPKDDNKIEANETTKSEKLQISDLNIERLTVNQLLASKIVVSEIDTTMLSADEIRGKSGTIKLNDLELSPERLSQLTKQISEFSPDKQDDEQKKTSTEVHLDSAPKAANFRSISLEEEEIASNKNVYNFNINEESALSFNQQESIVRHSPIDASAEHSTSGKDDLQDISSQHFSAECTEQYQQYDSDPELPVPPPRSCTLEQTLPDAPPRTLRGKSKQDSPKLVTEKSISAHDSKPATYSPSSGEVDDQPPPRPPQPLEEIYFPSQSPTSFYAMRAKQYVDENIPVVPRRKRHQSTRSRPISRSRSTSDDSSGVPRRPNRLSRRFSEPSISELSGRLIQVCGSRVNNALKRLIYHVTENVLRNTDGKQDLHVFMIILLVLIAGLILLGYGEDRTVVHLHHWEYFNPPKDI